MLSQKEGWKFLSPTIVILIFVGLIPFLYVIHLSLFNFKAFTPGKIFIGLENFRNLFYDPIFLHCLSRGLLFASTAVSIQLILGLFLASMLNREFIGKGLVKSLIVLPIATAPIVVGTIWLLFVRPGVGPLWFFFKNLGLEYNIGSSGIQAFLTVVLMDTWHWTPFVTLTLLAGMVSLPRAPFEAAKIDGANKWQIFRHITLPLLRKIILIVLLIRFLFAFAIFDEVWMLTGGGPGLATRFIGIHIVRGVIAISDYGYYAAMSVYVLYIVIILCWLLVSLLTRRER